MFQIRGGAIFIDVARTALDVRHVRSVSSWFSGFARLAWWTRLADRFNGFRVGAGCLWITRLLGARSAFTPFFGSAPSTLAAAALGTRCGCVLGVATRARITRG